MKITEIQVDRFGAWRNLALPVAPQGLSLFYGPNEAGKTTLLRFIRGVLYGFEPHGLKVFGRHGAAMISEGTLHVQHGDQRCRVRRTSEADSAGQLEVGGLGRDAAPEALLGELLQGVSREVFDRVFAIGLRELQELATLHADEVADRIYGLSLGHDGRRLLGAIQQAEQERRKLLDPASHSGRLARLAVRREEIARDLHSVGQQRKHYVELCAQRDRLEDEIEQLQQRRRQLQDERRGRLLLEKVWKPWNDVRQLQQELDALPAVSGFPEDGLKRLGELNTDLAAAEKCRRDLLAEAAAFRKQADQLHVERGIRRNACTLRELIGQRESLADTGRELKQAEAAMHEHGDRLAKRLQALGPAWSPARLEQVDASPAAHVRLLSAARSYAAALRRRARLRRRLQRLSRAAGRHAAELKDAGAAFGGSLEAAVQAARDRLRVLEDLERLRLRAAELEQRRRSIHDQLNRQKQQLPLPRWLVGVLAFLFASGSAFFLLGVFAGMTTSAWVGLAYALFGATCQLTTWGVKHQWERGTRQAVEQLERELDENDFRRRETRLAIQHITAGPPPAEPAPTSDSVADLDARAPLPIALVVAVPPESPNRPCEADARDADRLGTAFRHLAELERLVETKQRVREMRRRMTELRARYREVQRDVSLARQNWCENLTRLGLAETVKISAGLEAWQHLLEAQDERRAWEAARSRWQEHRRSLQNFRQKLDEVARRIGCWDDDLSRPLELLTAWKQKYRTAVETHRERRRLLREARSRRREAAEYRARIDELKLVRSALLVQGGAATEEEFEQRARDHARRRELEELKSEAALELEAAARSEPELAVVEEDLRGYHPDRNAQQLFALAEELQQIERALERLFERLGACKQELETLAADRRGSVLRCEYELASSRLSEATGQWLAVQTAREILDAIRRRVERTCQPHTLARASRFLMHLTRGRYHNIWTPLGERRLCIDDDRQDTYTVEQLSRGTREQLFLAVRLAMIEEMTAQGVELPMVLDDVLVNFDEARTAAAVDALLEFAAQRGQQILLFTCHLHLAHLLERKGIAPMWLPERQHVLEERMAG